MNQVLEHTWTAPESKGVAEDRETIVRTDAVSVVYTTVDDTLEAARVGSVLAKAMASRPRGAGHFVLFVDSSEHKEPSHA